MGSTALILVRQVAIMFILTGVGYVLFRTGKITLEGGKTIGNILIFTALPCVIINSFLVERTPERLAALPVSAVAALVVLVISCAAASLIFKKDPIATFGASFSNPGFFGMPLILASLPEGSAFYVAAFIGFLNLGQWTYGVAVMTGKAGTLKLKSVVTAPFFVAIVTGLFLFLTAFPLPTIVRSSISSLAGINTALAMFTIGVYLGQTDIAKMFTKPVLYRIAAVRLVIIPLLALAVLTLVPEKHLYLKLAILIAAACPVGSNVAVYAQLHKCNYTYAVESVIISTLFSIITIPAVVTLAELVW